MKLAGQRTERWEGAWRSCGGQNRDKNILYDLKKKSKEKLYCQGGLGTLFPGTAVDIGCA